MTQQLIQKYRQLRDEVTRTAEVLSQMHADHMQCAKGCHQCCMDLSVWPVEFYSILDELKQNKITPVLNNDKECGFLDADGGCQIYPFRPMICRTHGLALVYWHEETDPPGYGVMFCEKNFTDADDIAFDPENTLNMDDVNEQLARLNVEFVQSHPELGLDINSRMELSEIVKYIGM